MLSECRAIEERMNCEYHSRLNFWAVQNSGSDQISPPRSLAFVCERQRTSANAERMLNYYWANWYESGATGQFCKRFTFANGYSLKWDRAYTEKHTGHIYMVCSCLNAGPWWCKANPILIYQGVHCCTNVCYLHLDISPLKSVTIVWDFISVHKALQWALYYVIPEQIWMI